MSDARTSHPRFVFLEVRGSGHHGRKVRSHLARKAWMEKRLDQMREFQKSSIPLRATPVDPYRRITISNAESQEAEGEAQRYDERDHPPQRAVSAELETVNFNRPAIEVAHPEGQPDSLLTATERELINFDPFRTLPCRLNRLGQDLAYRAKSLFLHSAPNWASVLFTETISLRLAYMDRTTFCSMLAAASSYLDAAMGPEVSVETLQWTAAAISCVKRTLSTPGAQNADEALIGVLTLLAIDQITEGGKNSHLHSKALARLFRQRGGIQALHQSYTMDLFTSFLLITPIGKGQVAYLNHVKCDVEGAAELEEWKADVGLLVSELQHLTTWHRAITWEDRAERRALIEVVGFLPHPTDVVEEDQWAFVICYLAVMLWDYRYRARDCDRLLRDLACQFQRLRQDVNLADVAWLLVRGLDSNRHRKWRVIRMVRVLHRLSRTLKLAIGQFLYGLIDPRQARVASLDTADFERVHQEAFAGLQAFDSATWR